MTTLRRVLGGVLAASLLATTATPAMARPGYGWGGYHGGGYGGGYGYGRGYGYRPYRHYSRGGNVAGALIGGLVIGGAIAAIASAADRQRDRDNGVVYGDTSALPDRGYDRGYDYPATDSRRDGARADTQGAAVDACSDVALAGASQDARINGITRVDREGEGWRVEGVIDSGSIRADGYRALDRFSCSVRYGSVEDFRLDRG